ncbi:hypothetical protein BHE90_017700 [Fusarium euwallaceae]|uniref:Uncharacterized protein n=1 Tax=Fusarium euwallaceae TaxID=1147111 RepID=A0A430KWP2_9HYPO|nr:hypothetical protein BHE90_017700 [Fusarium euwallaceae]
MSPDSGRSLPSGRFPAPPRTSPKAPYLYQTTGNATDHAPGPGQEAQNLDIPGVRWPAAGAQVGGDIFPGQALTKYRDSIPEIRSASRVERLLEKQPTNLVGE